MLCYLLVFRFYCMGSYMYTVGLDVDTSIFYSSYNDIAVPTVLKYLVVSHFIWFLLKAQDTPIVHFRFLNLFTLGGLSGVVSKFWS